MKKIIVVLLSVIFALTLSIPSLALFGSSGCSHLLLLVLLVLVLVLIIRIAVVLVISVLEQLLQIVQFGDQTEQIADAVSGSPTTTF